MSYEFDKDLKDCVVLSIGTNAPPRFRGGLDQSMWSIALRMVPFVRAMHLLACVDDPEQEFDDVQNGIAISRRAFPRPYPATEHGKPIWEKLQFQISDHLNPRNTRIFREYFDGVKPDVVLVHSLVGVGYNVVSELSRANVRVVFYLHELGLVCVNRAMYRGGHSCVGQCLPCKLSSGFQNSLHAKLNHVAYISPSRANLDIVKKYFDMGQAPSHAILNANSYPRPQSRPLKSEASPIVISFVGRVDREKGVGFVLDVLRDLSVDNEFLVNIVGDGAELLDLRQKFGQNSWCRFYGWRSQTEVAEILYASDFMLAPSLWTENSPGVVAHSLFLGVPVVASAVGGMLDLVKDRVNGMLATVGDRKAWLSVLGELFSNTELLAKLQSNAREMAPSLDADNIFLKHKKVIDATRSEFREPRQV